MEQTTTKPDRINGDLNSLTTNIHTPNQEKIDNDASLDQKKANGKDRTNDDAEEQGHGTNPRHKEASQDSEESEDLALIKKDKKCPIMSALNIGNIVESSQNNLNLKRTKYFVDDDPKFQQRNSIRIPRCNQQSECYLENNLQVNIKRDQAQSCLIQNQVLTNKSTKESLHPKQQHQQQQQPKKNNEKPTMASMMAKLMQLQAKKIQENSKVKCISISSANQARDQSVDPSNLSSKTSVPSIHPSKSVSPLGMRHQTKSVSPQPVRFPQRAMSPTPSNVGYKEVGRAVNRNSSQNPRSKEYLGRFTYPQLLRRVSKDQECKYYPLCDKKDCKYFHPIYLCEFSINNKVCLKQKCPYQHFFRVDLTNTSRK